METTRTNARRLTSVKALVRVRANLLTNSSELFHAAFGVLCSSQNVGSIPNSNID